MIAPGTRIGSCEIIALLGAGGMGEVYRARDLDLGREVAVKVLPVALAADADRLARFRREAQLLASLNHPHIATIHRFEQDGDSRVIVLEIAEGGTLADRLARGPLPAEEALEIAGQIALALQAAHDRGILHRDLKPSNVAFTADGRVKVLDFGLAKLADANSDNGSPVRNATLSPTMTSPALTGAGLILGTAAYMSPEQARGKPVDKRADIWAFGCVLYEMLTGRRAFEGEDATETIAAVVKSPPDWTTLPSDTPRAIRALLPHLLEKDPRRRAGDIAVALYVLNEASTGTVETAVVQAPRRFSTAAYAAVLALTAVVAAAAAWILKPTSASSTPSLLTEITPLGDESILSISPPGSRIDVAPDGSHLIWLGASGGRGVIFARRMSDGAVTQVIERGTSPFIDPAGRRIGFFDIDTIRRVSISGGPSVEIARYKGAPRGAAWAEDGAIVFATAAPDTGLQRVSEGDSGVTPLTTLASGEGGHWWPRVIRGRNAVLFTIMPSEGPQDGAVGQIAVADLGADPPVVHRLRLPGSDARYLPSGHLVYLAGTDVRAVRFDQDALQPIGEPETVISGVVVGIGGTMDVAVTDDGTLYYVKGGSADVRRSLVLVNHEGDEQPLAVPPGDIAYPRTSPDGSRIAFDRRDTGERQIWTVPVRGGAPVKVTRDTPNNRVPLWWGNDRILFTSDRVLPPGLFWQRADGGGVPQPLMATRTTIMFPLSILGDWLVAGTNVRGTGGLDAMDLVRIRLPPASDGADSQQAPLVVTPDGEFNGVSSPDSRFLAFQSNASGEWQIHIVPAGDPQNGARDVASIGGGLQPVWSRAGDELYFLTPEGVLMGVPVKLRVATWKEAAGAPRKVLDASGYYRGTDLAPFRMYDVTADRRFVMVKAGSDSNARPSRFIVKQNWFEELRRLLPAN